MTEEPGGREPPRTPATRGRRFKPHELELADGGRLGSAPASAHGPDRGSRETR